MNYAEALEKLAGCGQEHLLAYWKKLTKAQRKALLDQIATIDPAELKRCREALDNGGDVFDSSKGKAPKVARLKGAALARAVAAGEKELRGGKVAALLVAGGQGSRLGYDGPKGCYSIGPITGAPLFYFHARKILARSIRYGAPIPFYVMTSEANNEATVKCFEENDYFGLNPDDVFFFTQGMWPGMTKDGKVILDGLGHVFMSPDGHGGLLAALKRSGALADMKKRGVKSVFFFQVDNPLVEIADPAFIGHHVLEKSEYSLKLCAKRDPYEKVGMPMRFGTSYRMVEYTEMSDDQCNRRGKDGELYFRYGSPAIHVFDRAFLEREAGKPMPLHLAFKKIPSVENGKVVKPSGPNGYKFEKFIFDILPNARKVAFLAFGQKDEFSPVKNADGADSPESCRADMRAKWVRCLQEAGVSVPEDMPVEIDPVYALDAEDVKSIGLVLLGYTGKLMDAAKMLSALLLSLALCGCERAAGTVREKLDEGWLFMRADSSASETNSAAWKPVRVPHDWGVDKPFDPKNPYGDAYLEPTGIGWYRYSFRLDARKAALIRSGGRLFFESNGAMSNSKVWINGRYVGGWPYGYTPFRCDLTAYVNVDGENEITVRCHNKKDSSRWYTGGGLYRECRLAWCPKDHLVPGSVAITTRDISKSLATVDVRYEMSESGAKGFSFKVENPRLWDIDDPYLYTLEIEGERFRYGIRTISFHADMRGFQLNGRRVRLNGVSLHHDLGVLGAAYNSAAMRRRFLKLKEAGVNAVRCAHNQEDPDFLDLCDELGLLVKDEIFDEWRHIGNAGKRKDGYTKLFDEWHERDVRAWIRTNRNHPSIVMWSLGNEICDGHPHIAPTAEFIATAKKLDAIAKSEDRTRPTTNANNAPVNTTNEYGKTLDIYGFNYYGYTFAQFKRKNPDKPFFASESQCMIASRGEFIFPVTWGWTMENSGIPYATSFGTEACGWPGNPGKGWACPPDVQWYWMDRNPECMGEFVWTGWDYLGGPYWADKMVERFGIKGIHSCATGFFDLAGFRKDTFYLYQSRWMPEKPMAHILPHWNWPERVGKVTPVHVFTSGDEGELFLNGRSLGRRKKVPEDFKRAYRLVWEDVVYEPGTLKVVVYRNGKRWSEAERSTTGAAAKMVLEGETTALEADGKELMFVNLSVVDAQGREVPRSRTPVEFFLEGEGELVATDNGDETDFTSFHSHSRYAFNGKLQAIVRAKKGARGSLKLKALSPGLPAAEIIIPLSDGKTDDKRQKK